ncbi:MAG: hypothetical protein VX899_12460 [Myxococcota bacterium]|nr:hypothetical protein [Myxococcota bacterium]
MALPKRTLPLSLHSPLSMEDCAARLEALAQPSEGFWRMHHHLGVERSGPDRFTLKRHAGRNLIAVAECALHPQDSGTRVQGTVSVHALTWFLPLVATVFVLPIHAIVMGGMFSDRPAQMALLIGGELALGGGLVAFLMTLSLRNRAALEQRVRTALEG